MLITEMVGLGAILGAQGAGKIIEVKTALQQFGFGHIGFTAHVQFLQYPAVAAQDVVDVAHVVVAIAVKLVVVAVAALVVAKLFVAAALQGGVAIKAGSGFGHRGLCLV